MAFFRSGRILILFLLLGALAGCEYEDQPLSAAMVSKDHLRAALVALDGGDEQTAISELQLSIDADPLNSRARVTLASVYARQAGITLGDWLDPLLEASRTLSVRLASIRNTTEIIDEMQKMSGAAPQGDLTGKLAGDIAKFSLGAGVLFDLFHAIPLLEGDSLEKLDQAIELLRAESPIPIDRAESTRIYLAILAMIRTVDHLKYFLSNPRSTHFDLSRGILCSIEVKVLSVHLHELRKSIKYVEEGLLVNPADPPTSQRAARVELQKFVSDFLISDFWEQIDDFSSDSTPAGIAGHQVAKAYCSKS